MSDILEGVVSNDLEQKPIVELWFEEGNYRKWLRNKLVE